MGNSEVGHLNIGAGRVVYQDIVAINLAFEKNTVLNNRALVDAAKRPAKKIHLLGMSYLWSYFSSIFYLIYIYTHKIQYKIPQLGHSA